MAYLAPYLDPRFSQSLDKTRPHTLLTPNTKRAGQLTYRYDDTGEEALVPNMWYNQTYQTRVEAVRWEAKQTLERAEHFKKYPPINLKPDMVNNIYNRYLERAARIYAEADRMEKAGDDAFPVAASLMQLNFGDNVSL